MKKQLLFTAIAAVFILSSCSKQQKAESVVKNYLKAHLDDPASYESVNSTKLDTAMSGFYDAPGYHELNDSMISVSDKLNSAETDLNFPDAEYVKKQKETIEKGKKDSTILKQKIDAIEKEFKPKQVGWRFTHNFKAKSKLGLVISQSAFFVVDNDFSKVIYTDLK